jgi:hypothetical protein
VAVGKKKKTKIVRVQKEMIDWIVANPEHKDCACFLDCDFGPGSFLHNDEVDAAFQKAHDRELSIINQFKERAMTLRLWWKWMTRCDRIRSRCF